MHMLAAGELLLQAVHKLDEREDKADVRRAQHVRVRAHQAARPLDDECRRRPARCVRRIRHSGHAPRWTVAQHIQEVGAIRTQHGTLPLTLSSTTLAIAL